MNTLFDANARASIHARIEQLQPTSARHWGKMDAPRMVCHATDQLRVALGELETRINPGIGRFKPIRQVLVFWLPWPKGRIETAPEMLTAAPGSWEEDISALHAAVDRCGQQDAQGDWPKHPLFGPLSGEEWGALSWKHLDYHLRQFGV